MLASLTSIAFFAFVAFIAFIAFDVFDEHCHSQNGALWHSEEHCDEESRTVLAH